MGESDSQGSDLCELELRNLEDMSKPDSTKKSTEYGVRKFNAWVEKRGKMIAFHSVEPAELNELLRKFYAEVKSNSGSPLTPSSLTCIRAAIHRHLTGAPYYRTINIIKDKEFTSANNMFTARCNLYFKTVNKQPQHKKAIEKGDMIKLGQYFQNWDKMPDVLLETCWFFLCFYFGRRGREGWTGMIKKTFAVGYDSENNKYVHTELTESTKNHQGGQKQNQQGYSNVRMYGPGVDIYE